MESQRAIETRTAAGDDVTANEWLVEHDMAVASLTRHGTRQVVKADLVSVLAVRCEAIAG